MLYLLTLLAFALAAMVTSSLSFDERRWRWAAGCTAACALVLTTWTGAWLQKLGGGSWAALRPAPAFLLGSLPFVLVLVRLWLRRQATPRHIPSLDDDPVMRRYLAEKVRRIRRQRQEEERLESNSDANAP